MKKEKNMNSNRKILCGAAALVVSAGFFGAAFLIPGLSDHINRLGNGNLLVYGAMLLIFCLVFLGGHASDRTVGDRHMAKQKK